MLFVIQTTTTNFTWIFRLLNKTLELMHRMLNISCKALIKGNITKSKVMNDMLNHTLQFLALFLWKDQSKRIQVLTRHLLFHDKQDYKNTQICVGPDLLAFFQGQSHH